MIYGGRGLNVLRPERLYYFRVVVPVEYELNLLHAFASLGEVHLHAKYAPFSLSLPPLLQNIITRNLPPSQLDVSEALNAVSPLLRSDDPLLLSLKDLEKNYRFLLMLKEFVSKLSDIGLHPKVFRETLANIRFSWLIVPRDSDIDSIISEYNKNGILARVFETSIGDTILLLTYDEGKENIVKDLSLRLKLIRPEVPSWFYGDSNTVLNKIDKELNNLRERTYEILIDATQVIQDSLKYEYASRIGPLKELNTLCSEVRKHLDKALDLAKLVSALRISEEIIKRKSFSMLKELDTSPRLIELVECINETTLPSWNIMYTTIREHLPELNIAHMSYLQNLFFRLESLLKLVSELKESDAKFLAERFRIYSIKSLKEVEALKVFEKLLSPLFHDIVSYSISEDSLLVKCINPSLFASLDSIAQKLGIVISHVDKKEVSKLIERINKHVETLKNEILLIISFSIVFSSKPHRLQNLIGQAGLYDLAGIFSKLQRLSQKELSRVSPMTLPPLLIERLARDKEVALNALNEAIASSHTLLKVLSVRDLLSRGKEYQKVLERYLEVAERVLAYEPIIEMSLRAVQSIREFRIFRDRRVAIAEGWIPEKYTEKFKNVIEKYVPKIVYLEVKRTTPHEEAPTLLSQRGLLGRLIPLTLMRDVPRHWEIDPTPLFTVLFTLMYGMMFGDIGLGLILTFLGLFFYRTKRSLLGVSREGMETLSVLMILCGSSATVFGVLYGILFLLTIYEPILPSPLHETFKLLGIALLFGAIQLIIALCISIVNYILEGEYMDAIFSGKGVLGLVFYLSGILLAYNIIKAGYDLSIVFSPNVAPITVISIITLIAIPASSIIKGMLHHNPSEVTHGVIELLELIIEYPANTISYMRLAAFAMAHEAFGLLAHELAKIAGLIPSLLFSNLLVLGIEGFAVGIQALRLVYYEFSTKFLRGGGIPFTPLRLSVRGRG